MWANERKTEIVLRQHCPNCPGPIQLNCKPISKSILPFRLHLNCIASHYVEQRNFRIVLSPSLIASVDVFYALSTWMRSIFIRFSSGWTTDGIMCVLFMQSSVHLITFIYIIKVRDAVCVAVELKMIIRHSHAFTQFTHMQNTKNFGEQKTLNGSPTAHTTQTDSNVKWIV